MITPLSTFLARLFRDESGQDLVEYALLTGVVGLGGAVAAPLIGDAIEFAYGTWVDETNNLWQSPDPTPSGS
jgi:Flp pilus assembly pilin Flp